MGITTVVACPGYRDVPLILALAATDGIAVWPHPEERSAAFIALGKARVSGTPVAVITTSGSAVANCLPAVVEAAHAGVRLVVISANRPPELHDSGAPQTMHQAGIFGDFSSSYTLPLPSTDDATWHQRADILHTAGRVLAPHRPRACAYRCPTQTTTRAKRT